MALQQVDLLSQLFSHQDLADGWECQFQKMIDQQLTLPWAMATIEDLHRIEDRKLKISTKIMHQVFERLLQASVKHSHMHDLFLNILHMKTSIYRLAYPKYLGYLLFQRSR